MTNEDSLFAFEKKQTISFDDDQSDEELFSPKQAPTEVPRTISTSKGDIFAEDLDTKHGFTPSSAYISPSKFAQTMSHESVAKIHKRANVESSMKRGIFDHIQSKDPLFEENHHAEVSSPTKSNQPAKDQSQKPNVPLKPKQIPRIANPLQRSFEDSLSSSTSKPPKTALDAASGYESLDKYLDSELQSNSNDLFE